MDTYKVSIRKRRGNRREWEGIGRAGSKRMKGNGDMQGTQNPLAQEAADFYLLEDMGIRRSDRWSARMLGSLESRLAREFEAYLVRAVGGELRYLGHFVSLGSTKDRCDECDSCERNRCDGSDCFCSDDYYSGETLDVKQLPEALAEFLVTYPYQGIGRNTAWRAWERNVISAIGAEEALKHAICLFEWAVWGPQYGGESWGHIARIAHERITRAHGMGNARLFVDRCFDLQHNSGSAFNKEWVTDYVQEVLDAHADDDMHACLKHASAIVRKRFQFLAWKNERYREVSLYGAGCASRETFHVEMDEVWHGKQSLYTANDFPSEWVA